MDHTQGRNLIISATCLILLAGSLRLYIDTERAEAAVPGSVHTISEVSAACDRDAIELTTTRIGCQTSASIGDVRVRRMSGLGLNSGAAKFVSVNR